MNLYNIACGENPYASPSPAYVAERDRPRPEYFVQWPRYIHADLWQAGLQPLQESLTAPEPASEDLVGQVFGNQLRQQKLSLKHLARLLSERALLYARHVAEIKTSHLKFQGELFCEKLMCGTQATKRQISLEGLLVQLERDKRKEETDFWKDSKDIREVMFEQAGEYQSGSHRAQLLSGIGGGDERL